MDDLTISPDAQKAYEQKEERITAQALGSSVEKDKKELAYKPCN